MIPNVYSSKPEENSLVLKDGEVIAICKDGNEAHSIAETFAYLRTGNALYAFAGIQLACPVLLSSYHLSLSKD